MKLDGAFIDKKGVVYMMYYNDSGFIELHRTIYGPDKARKEIKRIVPNCTEKKELNNFLYSGKFKPKHVHTNQLKLL